MTSSTSNHIPVWRNAWLLDDPEWVKARKQAWKDIKKSAYINKLLMPRKDELKKIQNFYLTGSAFDPELPETEWHWYNYHPDTRPLPIGGASMLVELWITADDSESNWQHIYEKYSEGSRTSAREKFREALHRLYPEHGSLFSGRDGRIYQLLGPTRCRREDYSDKDEESYFKICKSVNAVLGVAIKNHLSTPNAESDIFIPMLAREWCDSLPGTYYFAELIKAERPKFIETFMKGLDQAFTNAHKIDCNKDQYSESQVELARNINRNLLEMEIPTAIQKQLNSSLSAENRC